MREYIDAASFKEMILCADAALHANIQAINDLNVFPVPDGDTGTNMGLTINNAAAELRRKDFETVAAAAECVAGAMLRGARGNSGVILSLLFRGISRRLKGTETAGAAEFAGAMSDGVEAAYKAVMKPAEGTMLTVSRLASAAAVKAADKGATLEDTLAEAIRAGELALEDTVNQNPVLKKAGVIDAGGKGYIVILHAILASLRGEIRSDSAGAETEQLREGVFSAGQVDVPEKNIFDTVYVVRKKDPSVDLTPLRLYLDSIGDSLVISDDDEIFKVHVHTDIPGAALTESQKYGALDIAKIENMRLQALDLLGGRAAKSTDDLHEIETSLTSSETGTPRPAGEPESPAEPEKEYGVVAVCAGAGLEALFRELGADGVVTGGQTMNPSTDDILREVNRTPASTVFVFPNNKNIIMAAEQCVPLTEKKVIVMPSKTVPQGISALLSFSPDESEESLVGAMGEAMGHVHTAMVTYAARDSDFGGHSIHEGEYLALLDGQLVGSYRELEALFAELAEACRGFDPEFITVYYGEDVNDDAAEKVCGMLSSRLPGAELSVVNGGQPVYYFMVSIE